MKKLLFIATGGTIASGETAEGLTPKLSSEELLGFLPDVSKLAEIDVTQPMSLDSTNLTHKHWTLLAQLIQQHYAEYDGFVIAHGTDTMAYGAAALSCLIQNSVKPVILTGSQRPISFPDTDAVRNLIDAFLAALDERLCGVVAVFCGRIIDGRSAKKVSTRDDDAFRSLNRKQIGQVDGGKITISSPIKTSGKTQFYDKLSGGVMTVKLTPSMPICALEAGLSDSVSAVIIEGFGTGGLPDYGGKEYEKCAAKLLSHGKKVIMTTQVISGGSDLSLYKVGREISEKYHLIEARMMTSEYAAMRAMWALANADENNFAEMFCEE